MATFTYKSNELAIPSGEAGDTVPGCCDKLHTGEVSRGPMVDKVRRTHKEQLLLEIQRHSGVMAQGQLPGCGC